MNKLVIPTILLATVMVAGMFAFMPVDQASTVHTTIQGSQSNQVITLIAQDTATTYLATSNADFTLDICFSDNNAGTVDDVQVRAGSGGGTIFLDLRPAGVSAEVVQCASIGGNANDSYDIIVTDTDGTTRIFMTLVTTNSATASITVP